MSTLHLVASCAAGLVDEKGGQRQVVLGVDDELLKRKVCWSNLRAVNQGRAVAGSLGLLPLELPSCCSAYPMPCWNPDVPLMS
jgi:hypothetical protein